MIQIKSKICLIDIYIEMLNFLSSSSDHFNHPFVNGFN